MRSILDYIKVFKNIETYKGREPRNMYSEGQLVQNTVDGSRPGYSGEDSYNIERAKKRKEAKAKGLVYDPQTKKFRKSKMQPSEYGTAARVDGKRSPEYYREYYKANKVLSEKHKKRLEQNNKLKNFVGKKKKIKASVLRDFVLNDVGYSFYNADQIKKKFPKLIIEKDLSTTSPFEPLTKQQKTTIKENFNLPEGVEKWNFKKHKYGISSDKYNILSTQIINKLEKRKYKVAGNFSTPEGWMMNAMYRLYERELEANVKNLTYEPKFNKKGVIVGFTDNTAAGEGKTYYATEKAAKDFGDGTEWRGHGDFDRVSKFIEIADGVKAKPDEVLQKLLDEKGISKLIPKGKRALSLNDVLSHQRYYSTLAETSPKQLISRQIVLHHKKRIGSKDLAKAAATQDLQLLTGAVNAEVTKLENIVKGSSKNPARKLTNAEKSKLKNYGAKITDFDGKVVGGGYTDPTKQFAAIEKEALKYAKSDKFNVKTVTSYLERLGCGDKKAAEGGRILMGSGGALSPCAEKGQQRLNTALFKGGGDRSLVQRIISGGGKFALSMLNPAELIKLKNLVGPAALGIMAAYEAGSITDDVLRLGKPLDEALAGNWLTKSFLPYSEEFAKQKNLLQSGKLTGDQREYAREMMKMEEFIKEGQRIEGMEATQLVDQGGYGNIDGSSMVSKEDLNKAYQGLFERVERMKPYMFEEGITGRSLENEAAMNEYQDSRLAKTGEYTSAVSEDKFRLPGQRQIKRDENYEFASSPIFGGPQRLVNKAPRPKNIGRGGKGAAGKMELDYHIPGYTPYDRALTPSNDEILNYFKQEGYVHPRFGQLEPGEGTRIRMDLASQDGNRSIFGSKFAEGGRAGYMGGGITGILRPNAISPKRQGLRSILINGKKS